MTTTKEQKKHAIRTTLVSFRQNGTFKKRNQNCIPFAPEIYFHGVRIIIIDTSRQTRPSVVCTCNVYTRARAWRQRRDTQPKWNGAMDRHFRKDVAHYRIGIKTVACARNDVYDIVYVHAYVPIWYWRKRTYYRLIGCCGAHAM